MWAAPAQVYTDSIKILEAIAQEATYTQAAPILAALDRAHCEWRDVVESGAVSENQGTPIILFHATNCRGALKSERSH
jgi:hypothetical protein